MMRIHLTVAFLVALASPAFADDAHVDVPAGWTEVSQDLMKPILENVRKEPSTLDVSGTAFMSPDQSAQLSIMRYKLRTEGFTRGALEQFDRGVAAGVAKSAEKHISESRHFEGNQLLGESVDENQGMRIVQRRMSAFDSAHDIHLVTVACTVPKDVTSDGCAKALATATMTLPGVPIPAASDDDDALAGKSKEYRAGYLVGKALGYIAIVIAVLVFVIRARRRAASRA